MFIYGEEKFIRAHCGRESYYNQSYDRIVRECPCSNCDKHLGEQVKYPDFHKDFYFEDDTMNDWKFCPYCGESKDKPRAKNINNTIKLRSKK